MSMMDDPSTLPVTIGASSLPRPCFADRLATLRREGPMPPWRLLPGGFAETVYARSLVVIKAAQLAEDFKATGITCLMFQAGSRIAPNLPCLAQQW